MHFTGLWAVLRGAVGRRTGDNGMKIECVRCAVHHFSASGAGGFWSQVANKREKTGFLGVLASTRWSPIECTK